MCQEQPAAQITAAALDEAARRAGPMTRLALAGLRPACMLRDGSAAVRAEALRVLGREPQECARHAEQVLAAAASKPRANADG